MAGRAALRHHPSAPQTREQTPPAAKRRVEPKVVTIQGSMSVGDLAQKLGLKGSEVIRCLMQLGVMANINQNLDEDTAKIVATELGYSIVEPEVKAKPAEAPAAPVEDPALLKPRSPVVTVMGHVDHGKTSLLDCIRESNVTATEAGGITQHIGASQVEHNGKRVVFLDTPGHEAFTAMRARGAHVTDIVVLVVAADDGIMPQTIEAINHVRAAKVPMVVALNKIDKPGADPEKVKRQLTEQGLVPEEWGGETIVVPCSAITGAGVDNLLEMLLLVAEMQDLKANPDGPARGSVVEAELDKGRGPVATVLVESGTLKIGDSMVAGLTHGKVRAMLDPKGRAVRKAGPATPVSILGLADVPQAGDSFRVVDDERLAREISIVRQDRRRAEDMETARKVSLDDFFRRTQEGENQELRLVVKADVQGSVEALRAAIEKLELPEVKVNIIHGGVGGISENDIMLASASDAIVVGFNVRPDVGARKLADREKVDIRLYRIIYEALDDIRKAVEGLLKPEFKEVVLGRVEVRATFKVPKVGTIAGCYVTDGKVTRAASVRVIRDGVVIHEGKIESLKRFKDDAREVQAGFECGIGLEKFQDIREKDVIEPFVIQEVAREATRAESPA